MPSLVNAQTYWFQTTQPGEIWTPYRVGIKTDSLLADLHVNGSGRFNTLSSNSVVARNYANLLSLQFVMQGQFLRLGLQSNLLFKSLAPNEGVDLIRFDIPRVQFGIPGSSTYKVWVYGTLYTKHLQSQSIVTNSIRANEYRLSGVGPIISPGGDGCANKVNIGGGFCNNVVMFPEESQRGRGRVGIGTSDPVRKLHVMTNENATSVVCCRVHPGDIMFRQAGQQVNHRAGIRIEHVLRTSEHITWDIVPAKDSRPFLTFLWANSNQPVFKFYNTGTFSFTKPVASNFANGTVTWSLEPDAYKRGSLAFAKLRLKYHSELTSSGLPTFTDTGTLVTFQANPKRVNVHGQLHACGLIKAKEFKVELGWCDFVFHPDFDKPSWIEIKEHYTQHHRLPMMPPADSVETHGLPIGQALKATVYNVELNRLDITDLYEQINALKQELQAIKEENARLKQEIAQLKQNNQK